MFNRASSKSSEHLPRIAQLVVPEAATDAAAGASAAEGVVAPNVRTVVATGHISSRSSPIGIPWTVSVCCLVAAWALQTLTTGDWHRTWYLSALEFGEKRRKKKNETRGLVN